MASRVSAASESANPSRTGTGERLTCSTRAEEELPRHAARIDRQALVAQGIEHRFPKPCVAGSNPAGGTKVRALPKSFGRFTWSHTWSETAANLPGMARSGSTRRSRSRGEIETLPSGSLRVRVYAGIDPISGKRHYLTEVVPAGKDAGKLAEKARTRMQAEG
jgi:hypothetical protein